MTFINKTTGQPLADRDYTARVTEGGAKMTVLVNRRRVEVAFQASAVPGPVPVPPPTPTPTPSPGAGITPAGFAAALAAAKSGDVLLLAGGDFGKLASGRAYLPPLVIRSADPAKPAWFSGMALSGARGIHLDGVDLSYVFKAGDTLDVMPFQAIGCYDIELRGGALIGGNAVGLGAADNGYPAGRGLWVYQCTKFALINKDVRTWRVGAIFYEVDGLTVTGNTVTDIRSDGMDFVQVQNVLIEGNKLHDFRTPPGADDHSDKIQFWTSGTTKPSENITIRNNRLEAGNGTWSQGLFLRNEVVDQGQATIAAMGYRNVLIENNTIIDAHVNGLVLGEAIGAVVRNNVVQAAVLDLSKPYNAEYVAQFGAGAGIMQPQIDIATASQGVVQSGNVVLKAGQAVPAGVGAV